MKQITVRWGFRCRICQRKLKTVKERSLHFKTDHVGESPFHCAKCGKGFSSAYNLSLHSVRYKDKSQLHVGSGIHKCQYCGKEFLRKDCYNKHMLIHKGPRHTCPHCPKEYVLRASLIRHIRIHTGEKPYNCPYCEKRFSDKGACSSHVSVHTREQSCSCSYCGQTFSRKQRLSYHIRKHTGEGLVSCDVCSKSFTNKFTLKEHRLIHNRVTKCPCEQCGKSFCSVKNLQRHVELNHQASTCFCPFCPKWFSHQIKLKNHLMTHAGVKQFKCLLCDKAYSSRKALHDHLLYKHEISPEHSQYKDSFYAMSAAEKRLHIPQVSVEDSTSQSSPKEVDEEEKEYSTSSSLQPRKTGKSGAGQPRKSPIKRPNEDNNPVSPSTSDEGRPWTSTLGTTHNRHSVETLQKSSDSSNSSQNSPPDLEMEVEEEDDIVEIDIKEELHEEGLSGYPILKRLVPLVIIKPSPSSDEEGTDEYS